MRPAELPRLDPADGLGESPEARSDDRKILPRPIGGSPERDPRARVQAGGVGLEEMHEGPRSGEGRGEQDEREERERRVRPPAGGGIRRGGETRRSRARRGSSSSPRARRLASPSAGRRRRRCPRAGGGRPGAASGSRIVPPRRWNRSRRGRDWSGSPPRARRRRARARSRDIRRRRPSSRPEPLPRWSDVAIRIRRSRGREEGQREEPAPLPAAQQVGGGKEECEAGQNEKQGRRRSPTARSKSLVPGAFGRREPESARFRGKF